MAGYIGNKAVGINVTTGDILGDVGVGGDVTVGDDLTVTDDATIGGTALVTGVLTTTASAVFNGGFTTTGVSLMKLATNDNIRFSSQEMIMVLV